MRGVGGGSRDGGVKTAFTCTPALIHLARCVKFNPQFNPWIVLIGLRGTEFNRRINLLRGFGRFNLGLALIGFRTTGASFLCQKKTVYVVVYTLACVAGRRKGERKIFPSPSDACQAGYLRVDNVFLCQVTIWEKLNKLSPPPPPPTTSIN